MPTPAPHLVDEILEEIFLRLPTPAELARASTASPRFRRIITDRSFLRRHRKLYPPPLLGLVHQDSGFQPAEAPQASAPLARALADAADFTYSFVPVRPCAARASPGKSATAASSLRTADFWRPSKTWRCVIPCHGATCCSRPYRRTSLSRKSTHLIWCPSLLPLAMMKMRCRSR
ncbi:hypothetical protein VPH35_115750 [Triticum aestivum]